MTSSETISTTTAGPVLPGDLARARGLRTMRLVAFGLLLFAAVIFVATLDRGGAWAYVHATAEASMVGAIADWFAVTALFRHPLGLPIPHTALVPTRKNMLARSLQEFVTENFMSPAVVTERVRAAELSRRAGNWLADPAHSMRVVEEASIALRRMLARMDDAGVEELITDELLPRLATEPLSAVAGRLLEAFVADRAYADSVDLVLVELHRWLVDHPDAVEALVAQRAPAWSPRWLDQRLASRVAREIVAWVADMLHDREHPARLALEDLLEQFADDLQHDPKTIERAERFKQRMLGTPQVLRTATALWHVLRRGFDEALAGEDSSLRRRAVDALASFGRRLTEDAAMRERFDTMASDAAGYVVTTYGLELTSVITHTIERWDGAEAARRIELHVGRDLQFIRINGTLVGGLAGLVIYAVAQLL